ncbi:MULTISPECIES: excisionase [Giesbergeria]|uniref:Excisionase n=1 Tax=Giesbergeria sinuosa TaxID=80883 RepID=A0ABV9QHK0_9BURK
MNPSQATPTQPAPADFSSQKFMQQKVTEPTATATTVATQTPEWVLAEKFEELTGVTPMAVHNRRRAGIWLDGQHCAVIARRLYVNIKEADQWIKNQLPQPRRA